MYKITGLHQPASLLNNPQPCSHSQLQCCLEPSSVGINCIQTEYILPSMLSLLSSACKPFITVTFNYSYWTDQPHHQLLHNADSSRTHPPQFAAWVLMTYRLFTSLFTCSCSPMARCMSFDIVYCNLVWSLGGYVQAQSTLLFLLLKCELFPTTTSLFVYGNARLDPVSSVTFHLTVGAESKNCRRCNWVFKKKRGGGGNRATQFSMVLSDVHS